MRNESIAALRLAAAIAAAFAAGCDRMGVRMSAERSDALYQSAMADYSAGRLEKALKGFQEVVKANPSNASARFQLAHLLQDVKHDYLGAVCNYREYLLRGEGSDKASAAKERAAACERLLEAECAKKAGSEAAFAEVAKVQAEKAKLEEECKELRARMLELDRDLATSRRECSSLRKMVRTVSEEEDTTKPVIASVKELLEEDDSGSTTDRIRLSKDVDSLVAEERGESKASPLPVSEKPKAEAKPQAPEKEIPDTYVVQEGDTLYKIAVRFYGKSSAWSRIREANKTTISMDGRVKAGQKIVLPK